MIYSFFCYGHKNILATHQKTLEFTKDRDLSKRGDCIVGVNADFELDKIKEIALKNETIRITILTDGLKEEIISKVNRDFDSEHEIVLRKSEFLSARTLGTRADKASSDLNKELVNKMKDEKCKIQVTISGLS
jgi:uncharacterized protein